MRRCPQCLSIFTNPKTTFCLEDGTPLVEYHPPEFNQDAPTLQIQTESEGANLIYALKTEVQDNLDRLNGWWKQVLATGQAPKVFRDAQDALRIHPKIAEAVRTLSFPVMRHTAWDQLYQRAVFLLPTDEFRALDIMYRTFNLLTEQRASGNSDAWLETAVLVIPDVIATGNPLK